MLSGSLVAIATPMQPGGALDLPALCKLIDFHVANGTSGIVVVGTTGESPTVSFDEHCLLIKTAVDSGLDVRFDTFLSHLIGGPTAIGAAGENRLTSIMEFNSNVPVDLKVPAAEKFATDWRSSGHDTDFSALNFVTMIDMLTDAINKAGSTDPLKVALALEDMHEKDLLGQETIMRKEDHQLLIPYYAGVFSKDVKYDAEHTGFGWKNYMTASAADLTLPTICKMKRPE